MFSSNHFRCINCGKLVSAHKPTNRNHCPYCLFSRHLDDKNAGDRASVCGYKMEPIGLTFKRIRPDKYNPTEKGEIMLIHLCLRDSKVSLNRIAGDDNPDEIIKLVKLPNKYKMELINQKDIKVLGEEEIHEINRQLFGI